MFSTGRNQRNTTQMYNPMRTYASYCTEALQKTEMKRDFEDIKLDFENEVFLKNLHLIPDPLMKNLADTLVTAEKPEKARKLSLETPEMIPKAEVRPESTFAGITNFFSGVFSMLSGAMFRPRSPAPYYDFDADSHQGSPLSWRRANIDDEDKNGQTFDKLSSDAPSSPHGRSDMNINCKSPVTSCEEKLNHVKYLLKSPKPSSNPTRLRRRPKKVFVEPGSVEESLEDAFTPEDLVALPNDPTIECCSPRQWQNEGLVEAHTPKTKIDIGYINETTEIVKDVMEDTKDAEIDKGTVNNENQLVKLENKNVKPETDAVNVEKDAIKAENDAVNVEKDVVNVEKDAIKAEKDAVNVEKDVVKLENDKTKLESPKNALVDSDLDPKQQLVSSCEDKLSKLKALLQEKCKKNTNTNTTPDPITEPPVKPAKTIPILKPVDKHFKNPHRMLDKRRKMKMKRSIQDDVCFANEIEVDASSVDNSPSTINSSSDASLGDYFDELKGRFHSASTTESEDSFQIVFNDVPKRCRKVSDCDSEDSFIVFEDSPDCFTSNDVFCEESDSESDVSDSGCGTMTCKLAHSLSRTVSNLTDDTLYESGDEVDCARVAPELKIEESKGLLLDAHKKSLRKNQLPKKVTFSSQPPKVKVMRVWAYAARQARAGHWERFALDRDRFKRRIDDVDMAVSWVLKPQHRSRVMFQRFMPWWNAQRRKELAEKKEKDEERKRAEAERVEEEKRQEAKLLEGNGSQDVNDTIEDSVDKIQDSIEGGDVKKDLEGSIQNETEKKSEVEQASEKKAEIKNKDRIHTAPKNDSKNTKINDSLKKNTNSVPNIRGACKKTIVHKIPKEKMANYESNKIANDVNSKVIKTEPKTNVVNKNSANFNGGIDT